MTDDNTQPNVNDRTVQVKPEHLGRQVQKSQAGAVAMPDQRAAPRRQPDQSAAQGRRPLFGK